ncbi:hypothetical protein A2767_06500 [Candidatus Roizmanbacteria bacterium RIFCSPHIGHO2_01_FULL_35_10]|uniref:GxxExxY protein n=1 Tax=Candidatus Roizmanbacteria bacterium RIFCSPLOWO2_01_FULL_35_13 TaxID=1802055 RepID=A0A1F7IGW8_9BACT|nr:MAG: hypothetical protein A2767_06500 [Candidatus Roizmanbacteria bacterium RIFCSPHIGHO2_01_FULL_35_10]OGK42612.1 MAG: hypothetical protein A3A74_06275 [Candidatus Roizmanbacteria bacterium RIFCSPLOWO2_01_FULL_35_13]
MNANAANILIYPELSYKITGVLFAVHNELGKYCSELQCADKIEFYLKKNQIRYEREKFLDISFDGEKTHRNKIDFIVEDKIILEVKAKTIITKEDYYQVRRYLKALNMKLGILVNFRDRYLRPKRVLNSEFKEKI